MNNLDNHLQSWSSIKDEVIGKKGSERRDQLDREFQAFKIGLLLRQARKEKNLTQKALAERIDKQRPFISRIENNSENITLKTLYDVVEKGLGGKLKISIEF